MRNHPHLVMTSFFMMKKKKNKTFSIVTLGCKLNQFDSELMRERLLKNFWEEKDFSDIADFYIINSCTVTARSDARCRNAVRRARKTSPEATIIVTGCYAETQPEKLKSMRDVDLVIGNRQKFGIPALMERIAEGEKNCEIQPEDLSVKNDIIESFFHHSRAFVKIQDGCNSACSYCIIPRARGKSRSVPPAEVFRQIETLSKNGFREIVLTGIHIGRYGLDLDRKIRLSDLIETILEKTDDLRLRLSSIEVNEVDEKMLNLMNLTDRFARHLHIPMQSGDDEILKAMRRPYDAAKFADKIVEVFENVENVAIGTDIIVGFPGEDRRHFNNTYALASKLPLTYFHVFSFSPRPLTEAAGMPSRVHPEEKKRRSKKLIALGKRKRNLFMRNQVGKEHKLLLQGRPHRTSRFFRGLTGNYCQVLLKCDPKLKGQLVSARVNYYSMGRLYAVINESSSRKNEKAIGDR